MAEDFSREPDSPGPPADVPTAVGSLLMGSRRIPEGLLDPAEFPQPYAPGHWGPPESDHLHGLDLVSGVIVGSSWATSPASSSGTELLPSARRSWPRWARSSRSAQDSRRGSVRVEDALLGAAVTLAFSQLLFPAHPVSLLARAQTRTLRALSEVLELTSRTLRAENERIGRVRDDMRPLYSLLDERRRSDFAPAVGAPAALRRCPASGVVAVSPADEDDVTG
ncbi:hypothetical protein D0C37_01060 [Streptomyces koyangensis]|uniref:Uncharacterized protein n=2 Tax=Streptomyces koyangensis TaxID=188770 RepID=A0A385D4Y3_9ACTN|nr:hypothetical protein D0C37_01060 [Streptomyces koyangensis]PKR45784.1 hypothetical protein CWE27_08310 [Streptomyces sp. EAG2]